MNHALGLKDILFLMFILLSATFWGCTPATVSWQGSVDAVFKYRPKEKRTLVHAIRPESLSETAGLKAGDELLAIDGEDVTTASYGKVLTALRGPIGTFAVLTVKRGEKVLDFKVERKPIKKYAKPVNDAK